MSEAHVISTAEYDSWVASWNKQEKAVDPYPFFEHDGQVQTGVVFPFSSLRYLFSAVGVITIKVRFGLREFTDGRPAQFHLILFGVDNQNNIITPYFASPSSTHHHHDAEHTEGEGNLPMALMEEWKKSWHKKAAEGEVGAQFFIVNPQLPAGKSGFLQGYSYSVKEMMQAMGAFQGVSSIHFKFGLHGYYSLLATAGAPLTHFHTFGLILYAAAKAAPTPDSKEAAADGEVIDDSGYYDFSAPCPFTC